MSEQAPSLGGAVGVLVVDDEPTLSDLMSMALRYEGWDVRTAPDGMAAVRVRPRRGVPRGMLGQLLRFAAIGIVSTLAYLVLYALTRGAFAAFGANLFALVVTAVGNTAANRRLTFGVRGRDGAVTHQFQGTSPTPRRATQRRPHTPTGHRTHVPPCVRWPPGV